MTKQEALDYIRYCEKEGFDTPDLWHTPTEDLIKWADNASAKAEYMAETYKDETGS